VALLEVKRDRRGTGLMPAPVELLADGDDLLLDHAEGLQRAGQRSPRPRVQPRVALGQIPLHQGDHPPTGHAVLPRDLALAPPLDQHRGHDQLRHPHRSPLHSGVNDVPRQL